MFIIFNFTWAKFCIICGFIDQVYNSARNLQGERQDKEPTLDNLN
jgi:hypothetical protein